MPSQSPERSHWRVIHALLRGATAAGAVISGRITGGFGLEMGNGQNSAGAVGVMTLSNTSNDWAGNTTISSGTVKIGANEVIPNGAGKGNVTLNGDTFGNNATMDLNGKTETINGLSSSGDVTHDVVTNTGLGAVLNVGDNNQSSVYAGTISSATGSIIFNKIGTGTLTLSGVTSGVINTNIQNGAIKLGSANVLNGTNPSGGQLVLGSGANAGVLDMAGMNATITMLSTSGSAGAGNIIGNSSTTSDSTLTIGSGAAGNFAGRIQDSLAGGTKVVNVTINGVNNTFSGTSTYTGKTTIAGINPNSAGLNVTGALAPTGNVEVDSAGFLAGTGSVGNVTLNNGNVRGGATAGDGNIGSITMSSLTVNGGDFRMDLSTPANSDKYIVNGAANFAASSTLTLTSAAGAGTYTVLTAGSLTGTAPTLNTPPAGTTRSSLTLHFGDLLANAIQIVVAGSPANLTFTGGAGGTSGTWDLNTTANWTDGSIVQKFFNLDSVSFGNGPSNRTIQLDFTATPTSVSFSNSAGNDYTVQGGGGIGDSGLSGGTPLTISGGGKVTLSTNNSYLGPTNVQNGTLVLNNSNALPNGTSVTLGSGGTSGVLDLNGNNVTVSGLATSGIGAGNIVGNSSTSNSVTLNVNAGASTDTFGGVIQDTLATGNQTVGVTVSSGTLVLTGANTYSGQTTINNGATVQVGAGGTTGSIGSGNLQDDGTFIINRIDDLTIPGAINGGGTVTKLGANTVTLTGNSGISGGVTISAGTLQIGNGGATGSPGSGTITNSANLVFNQNGSELALGNVISGSGAIFQIGGNTVTFSGANTFTGPMTITNGVVRPGGGSSINLGAGTIFVSGNGQLDTNGVGTLTSATITISGSGFNGTGALVNNGADNINTLGRLVLSGDATIGGTGRFDIRRGTPVLSTNGNHYTLTKVGTNQFSLVAATVDPGWVTFTS